MDLDTAGGPQARQGEGGFRGFRVGRSDLGQWSWERGPTPDANRLADGEILVATDKFAFTANNITYGRLGEPMPFARFFPAGDGWQSIPVWGFATIVASRAAGLGAGQRIYGFLPMASHLKLRPEHLRGTRFVDGVVHRQGLPPTYNEYVLTDRTGQGEADEDLHLVLRPLFSLSFFCAAFLAQEQGFGARRIVISSASSKTALGLALLIKRSTLGGCDIVGLTSAGHVDFVRRNGAYDAVLPYAKIGTLSAVPTVYVDIAGNASVRRAVHHHLGPVLRHSARVGFTHWDTLDDRAEAELLPGPPPTLFFTADHILARRREWGPDGLKSRLAEAWRVFAGEAASWLTIDKAVGPAAVERIYRAVLDGQVAPDKAHVLSIGAA